MRIENSFNRSSVESLKRDESRTFLPLHRFNPFWFRVPGSEFRVESRSQRTRNPEHGTRNRSVSTLQRFEP